MQSNTEQTKFLGHELASFICISYAITRGTLVTVMLCHQRDTGYYVALVGQGMYTSMLHTKNVTITKNIYFKNH